MIRISKIVLCLVIISLLITLFFTKHGLASKEETLARLQVDLARERGRTKALEAEIALQEDPENLRRLASIYLNFEPIQTKQEIAFSQLPRFDNEDISFVSKNIPMKGNENTIIVHQP